MKRHGRLFELIVDPANIRHAWLRCLRGKRRRADTIGFSERPDDNLNDIRHPLETLDPGWGGYESVVVYRSVTPPDAEWAIGDTGPAEPEESSSTTGEATGTAGVTWRPLPHRPKRRTGPGADRIRWSTGRGSGWARGLRTRRRLWRRTGTTNRMLSGPTMRRSRARIFPMAGTATGFCPAGAS